MTDESTKWLEEEAEKDRKEMEEAASEIPEEPTGEGNYMENAKIELWLSTDGKHTVKLETNELDNTKRKTAIAKTMDLYDFVLARYGTKQAQAVKEYGNGKSGMQTYDDDKAKQDACKHLNIKFLQSKTEKNPGRWFKQCADCKKFLGWQDGGQA